MRAKAKRMAFHNNQDDEGFVYIPVKENYRQYKLYTTLGNNWLFPNSATH